MLFAIIYVTSTLIFGILFVVRVRKSLWNLFALIASGWLFGFSITSLLLVILSFFLKFSKTKSCFRKHRLNLEENPWLFLSIFVILSFGYGYMKRMYSYFPEYVPNYASEIFEFETSFIQSILRGINRKRRNFLTFSDPQVHGGLLSLSYYPLFYTASLVKLGLSYGKASLIICFMNTLSTIVFLYYATSPFSRHIFPLALCFAFNSGWAFIRVFEKSNIGNDLVHDIGRWCPAPWYQTLGVYLTLSKRSSTVIPLTLLALSCVFLKDDRSNTPQSRVSSRTVHSIKRGFLTIGGLAASLIPSASTSIAFFFAVSNFSPSFLLFLPSLFPKLLNIKIKYNPIWREYQMQGYFYSQVLTLFDSFGPPFFAIFIFPLTKPSASFFQKFLSLASALILCCFIREGNGHWDNALAITSVFFPILLSVFIHSLDFMRNFFKKPQYRGMAFAFNFVLISVYVIGGITSLSRLASSNSFIPGPDQTLAEIIKLKTPKMEPIFVPPMKMNPISMLTGHPIFIGDSKMLWNRGAIFEDILFETSRVHWGYDVSQIMHKYGYKYAVEWRNNEFIMKQNFLDYFQYVNFTNNWALLEIKNDVENPVDPPKKQENQVEQP